MFGLGVPELVLILVIALVLFGSKNLPSIGKALGQTVHEVRKATSMEPDKSDTDKVNTASSAKNEETKK
jgi:sec-independent protein translocase protein TatA